MKKRYKITEKNIFVTKHNIGNMTTMDNNLCNKSQLKRYFNIKLPIIIITKKIIIQKKVMYINKEE